MTDRAEIKPDDGGSFIWGLFFGIITGVLLMMLLADMLNLQPSDFRAAAIEAGCAHYDSQTGKFTWNNEAVDAE